MEVIFILPVRNRWAQTQVVLNQLTTQIEQAGLGESYGILVADDGSTDGTPEQVRAQFPAVILVEGTGNWWWTGAIAAGMDYALSQTSAQTIVWLNDDLELSPDFISNLQAVLVDTLSQGAIIGGIVRDRTHPEDLMFSGLARGVPIRRSQQFEGQILLPADTLNGNIVVIPRRLAKQLGLPDVRRFPHYGGDYEYTERAKRAGFSLYLCNQLVAIADYQVSDVVRYMPVWMQWYLAPSWGQKWRIWQDLWTLKFHHNVRHIVNRMYINQSHISPWRYRWFYLKKVGQCLASLRLSPQVARSRFQDYFDQQQIPPHLQAQIRALLP